MIKDQKQQDAYDIVKSENIISIRKEYNNEDLRLLEVQTQNQSLISRLLSRLKKFRRPTRPVNTATINQQVVHEHDHFGCPTELKMQFVNNQYFVLMTTHTFLLYRLVKSEGSICQQEIKKIHLNERLICADVSVGGIQMQLSTVSVNMNRIYTVCINGTKINFNEKVCGVGFFDQYTLLVHLQYQILVYQIRCSRVTFRSKRKKCHQEISPDMRIIRKDYLTRKKGSCAYVIYVARIEDTKNNYIKYNLMLEDIEIVDFKIEKYTQKLLEQYIQDIQIRDLLLFKSKHNYISMLIVLKDEVILVKSKHDKENKLFFTIQCSLKSLENGNQIFVLREKLLEGSAQEDKGQSNELIQSLAELPLQKVKSNLYFISEIKRKQTIFEQNFMLAKYQHTQENGNLVLLNLLLYKQANYVHQKFKVQLRDIIGLEKTKKTKTLVHAGIFDRKIIFFFLIQDNDMMQLELFYTQTTDAKAKINKLLPSVERIMPNEDYLKDQELELLLRLNQTYQKQLFPRASKAEFRSRLYKTIWEKIDKQSSDKMKYAKYLYKTRDLAYIKKQWKNILPEKQDLEPEVLKKHYTNLRLLAKKEIDKKRLIINFEIYLKSTFYLKKLEMIEQQRALNELDYKRWKKRDITEIFFMHWKNRSTYNIKKFLKKYKSYFIVKYEKIIKKIIELENAKSKKTDLLHVDNFQLLKLVLPYYKKNEEGNYGLQFQIEFQDEQTCFEDLDFAERLGEVIPEQIKKQEKHLLSKYMKNNDFLFMSRNKLNEIEIRLVSQNEAIFIFLAAYIQKQKNEQIKDYEDSLKLLLNGNFINLQFYFDSKCQIQMYNACRSHIQHLLEEFTYSLQQFLSLKPVQVFCLLIFESDNQQKIIKNVEFLLTTIKSIWDNIMTEKNEKVDDHTNSLNQLDLENAEIYETIIKKSFEIHNENNDPDWQAKYILRYQIFFKVIFQKSDEFIRNNQLLIQCLLYSVFKTIRIKTFMNQLTQICDAMQNDQSQDTPFANITEQYPQDLVRTLELVCENNQLFHLFNIDCTINQIENRNQYEMDYQPNYDLLIKMQLEYLNNDEKIQVLYFDGQNYTLNTLKEMFDLIMAFTLAFYRKDDMDWIGNILSNFIEEALDWKLEHQTKRPILQELELVLKTCYLPTNTMIPIYNDKLKQAIDKAKCKKKYQFMRECLNVLKNQEKSDLYVIQQEHLIKLEMRDFGVKDLQRLKADYYNITISHENKEKAKIEKLYKVSISAFTDQQIDNCQDYSLQSVKTLIENLTNSFFSDTFQVIYLIIKLVLKYRAQEAQKCKDETIKNIRSIKVVEDVFLKFINLEKNDPRQLQTLLEINWKAITQDKENEEIVTNKLNQNNTNNAKRLTRQIDTEVYAHVKEFLNQMEYYVFGQFLFEKFQRGMRYFLRYNEKLQLDFNKIILIIKGFLRSSPNDMQRKIELTIQMIYSYKMKSKYLLLTEKMAEIDRHIKEEKQQRNKLRNKQNAKINSIIQQFMELYKHYKKENVKDQHEKRKFQPSLFVAQTLGMIEQNKHTPSDFPKRRQTIAIKIDRQQPLETYFVDCKEFIKRVEKMNEFECENEEDSPGRNNFDMHLFRIYVGCVKYNENIHKLFPFEFFLNKNQFFFNNQDMDAQEQNQMYKDLMHRHLKRRIYEEIKQQNFIQLAKCLRYGFGNLDQIEAEVLLIYFEKSIDENSEALANEIDHEEQELYKKIKNIFDMLNWEYLMRETKSCMEQPNEEICANIVGLMEKKLQKLDKLPRAKLMEMIEEYKSNVVLL